MGKFGYIEQGGELIHRRKGLDDRIIAPGHWIKITFDGARQSGKTTCMRLVKSVLNDAGAEVVEQAEHELIVIHNPDVLANIGSY